MEIKIAGIKFDFIETAEQKATRLMEDCWEAWAEGGGMMEVLTINYTDSKGAGISKTVKPDHEEIKKVMNNLRREATLRLGERIIGKVEYLGKSACLAHGRRWNWWYDSEEIDKLKAVG